MYNHHYLKMKFHSSIESWCLPGLLWCIGLCIAELPVLFLLLLLLLFLPHPSSLLPLSLSSSFFFFYGYCLLSVAKGPRFFSPLSFYFPVTGTLPFQMLLFICFRFGKSWKKERNFHTSRTCSRVFQLSGRAPGAFLCQTLSMNKLCKLWHFNLAVPTLAVPELSLLPDFQPCSKCQRKVKYTEKNILEEHGDDRVKAVF